MGERGCKNFAFTNRSLSPVRYFYRKLVPKFQTSRNFIDFLVKVLLLLLGTIGCTIACGITIIIPLCMIAIGSVYFDECPAEPYIPIFLIVGGKSEALTGTRHAAWAGQLGDQVFPWSFCIYRIRIAFEMWNETNIIFFQLLWGFRRFQEVF